MLRRKDKGSQHARTFLVLLRKETSTGQDPAQWGSAAMSAPIDYVQQPSACLGVAFPDAAPVTPPDLTILDGSARHSVPHALALRWDVPVGGHP